MKTTKTWKQKIKSVALAAVIGVTIAFTGLVGNAAPAAAAASDYKVCYIDNTSPVQYFQLHRDTGCDEISSKSGTGRTPLNSNCAEFTDWKELDTDDICEYMTLVTVEFNVNFGTLNSYTLDGLKAKIERDND